MRQFYIEKPTFKGYILGLKENLNAVKNEIGTEEQFLEGLIKSERFFKRYKKYILTGIVVLVVGGISYSVANMIHQSNLQVSNAAYNKVLANSEDQASLKILKDKNERLYNFYKFQIALESNDAAALKELALYTKDPVISDLAAYQLSGLENKNAAKSELLRGFNILQEGYKLISENKIEEAKLKFAQIDLNSPLKNIANNLEHYQGKK
jgi:flagellar basal body-associated protein FliL